MEKYKPHGVCATEINFEIKEGVIDSVSFVRGCSGNGLGIGALIKGYTPEEAIKRLKGIDCRGKGTSCPDQLACALEEYLKQNNL